MTRDPKRIRAKYTKTMRLLLLALAACAASLSAQKHTADAEWPPRVDTWTGVISDSMCGLHHESGAEGQETTPAECTRDCVRGGSKYVLVADGQVYAVANQDHDGLPAHAGQPVTVTGSLDGDAITIATIAKTLAGR